MQRLGDVFEKALRAWRTKAKNYTVGVIKERWLVGPRPQRLGVMTGNLRSGVHGEVHPNGFTVGTNVKYGLYWEKGFMRSAGRVSGGSAHRALYRNAAVGRWQPPRKWLEPGVKEALPEIIRKCEHELKMEFDRVAKQSLTINL